MAVTAFTHRLAFTFPTEVFVYVWITYGIEFLIEPQKIPRREGERMGLGGEEGRGYKDVK